jgi:hypothetical protein
VPESEMTLYLGLYSPGDRSWCGLLKNRTDWQRKIPVCRMYFYRLRQKMYSEGWYPEERSPETGITWRWMGEHATLEIPDPGIPFYIKLNGTTQVDCFPQDPKCTISARGTVQQVLTLTDPNFETILVFKGDPDSPSGTLPLHISIDQVFVPDICDFSGDTRQLGIRLFNPETGSVLIGEGFYPMERDRGESWCWMGQTGQLNAVNPFQPSTLFLSLWTSFPQMDGIPQVVIKVNGIIADKFALDPGNAVRFIDLETSMLGSDEWVEITLETDRTFRSDSIENKDQRLLGIMVNKALII